MNETFLHGAWRTVVALVGVLMALAGLYLLLHALGVAPPLHYGAADLNAPLLLHLNLQQQPLPQGLLWMIGGALGIVAGGMLVALGLARSEGAGATVVLRGVEGPAFNGSGRVTVSMRSLHALASNVAERIDGVREAETRLRLKRSGWYVDCTVAHVPERPLPEIAAELQQRLRVALEHHTGLPVTRIDVAGQLGMTKAHRRVR